MQQRNITLFIPGLLGASVLREQRYFDGLAVAELELMLSRGRHSHTAEQDPQTKLFKLFGHSVSDEGLPVAAVTHLADQGTEPESFCLRADPVHLLPDRDRVVMMGSDDLSVSLAEAQQLAEEFNRLFAEDGLQLETPLAERWYLKAERAPAIRTRPLNRVVGQDIHQYLPSGADAMQWHGILNEVQMLFHASPVNEARRRRGLPEINSLWFWGEGAMPALPQLRWQQVWSNAPLSLALARLGGSERAALPASAEEWLEQAQAGGRHLVEIEAVADALAQQDLQRWRDMVESVNDDWLLPLIAALRTNSLASIRLLSDNAEFELDAKGLKRWWRRRRSLGLMSLRLSA